ncbi:MAG: hypothetical protein WCE61_17915 [Candidatus Acidiferrum sp.]
MMAVMGIMALVLAVVGVFCAIFYLESDWTCAIETRISIEA